MPIYRAPKWTGVVLLTLCVMELLSLLISPARAQVAGATVSGIVSDPSGAVIAKAQLVITNVATGVSTTVASNADGYYTMPNLIPGNYEMRVTAPHFETEVRRGITLEVGAQQVLNLSLKVGQASQTVEVTARAPDVQLASATIGAVVGSAAVVDLPLNGRSWTDLADLQPGTAAVTSEYAFDNPSDSSSRMSKAPGQQTSIDGQRPGQNNYRLDGISVNDYTNGPPANMTGGAAGVDAVQEFSVLTSNYSAEYGLTSGGVINSITRSGTNQFHGTAYEFIRNQVLDARNYFDGLQIPPLRRNQFGASIGGPIRKDRTFFFANYEGLREFMGTTVVNVVPSAAAHAGTICSRPDLAASSSPCTTSTVTVDPAAVTFLPLFPLPNAGLVPGGSGDTGFFNFVDPTTISQNFFTARIDHKFSDNDHVDGTYLISRSPFTFADNFDDNIIGFSNNYQVYSIEETHVFSTNLISAARVGVFRQYETSNNVVSTINPLAGQMALGSQPGYDAARVQISGLTEFGGGANAFGPAIRGLTNFQFYDDASWVHRTHSIKFGFAVERQDFNFTQVPIAGKWNFGSIVNFLTNMPKAYAAAAILTVPANRGLRDTIFGGYVQDDWRLRRNLTLNLGLRYEMMTNLTEVHGWESALTSLTAATLRLGNPFFESNPTLHNFEPRVGFAWDPFRDGKTSVRAGFGLFDSLPMGYEFARNMLNNAPFELAYSANSLPPGTFFQSSSVDPLLSPSSTHALYLEPNPHRTYVMQRNLSVQRQLSKDLTATISYVGSSGLHLLLMEADTDQVIPTATSAGWLYPNPIGSVAKINPNWGGIEGMFYNSPSFYNSLQAQVNKRMSHGLQIQGAFTWGKSIDDSSSGVSQQDNNTTNPEPPNFAPNASRALSDFNQSRTLVINAIWQVPEAKSLSGFAGKVINGWQLGAIYKVADGQPFTPTWASGANVTGQNDTPNFSQGYLDRLKGPGCQTGVNPQNPNNYLNQNCFSLPTAPSMAYWTANCDQTSLIYGSPATTEPYPICFNLMGNCGRNCLVGPGISNFDFSIFKNSYIKRWENFNVQFRAELFNIFNRPNFSAANLNDSYDANGQPTGSGGILTSTTTSARQIQFALKLIW